MDVHLIGLGTANPPLRFSQRELYEAYAAYLPLSEEARSLLHRVMVENHSIGFRHVAVAALTDLLAETQDDLIVRYQKFAVPVALEAARRALAQAGLTPADVDALVVNTCTGYLCPGLTSYVAEALPLKKSIRPFDLQGMGCGGALPNLETAYNLLQAHPDLNVLTLSVEMCTATIYFSEEPDILISNAIFGDGAAATVLTNRPGATGIRLRGFAAGLYPEDREFLYYRTEQTKLRNVLSARVPVLGGRHAKEVVDRLLAEQELTRADVHHWIIHPGGEKVLDAFERGLGLSPEALSPSRTVLYQYGNMSSASVLFVLEEVLRSRAPQSGELGVLSSFGAGFSAFAALVEF